jgi:nucleoside-diphosphate-sugar epimerase
MTKKRILITGATGFIGSHLTQRLVTENYEVCILKRKGSDMSRLKGLENIATYSLDLQDSREVSKAVLHFSPDVIYHLATAYGGGQLSVMIGTNVLGTINLLEAAKDTSVKLFVNTSSGFVYGAHEYKSRETDTLNPVNLYALTKIQAEQACSFYADTYGLKTLTFRLFAPYGSHDHGQRLIPYTIETLANDERPKTTTGQQRWDFVYIDDVIEAYLKILGIHNLPTKHEIYNIGTGYAISVMEVVLKIKEIIGSELEPEWGVIPHRDNEVWFCCADMSKTEAFLGWKPEMQILGECLEQTVKAYMERKDE